MNDICDVEVVEARDHMRASGGLKALEFRFVSAGHNPLVHAPRGDAPMLLDQDGLAIG